MLPNALRQARRTPG